ncbi:MAG: Hsp20 family protein, partial [Victivallales bacterium]|nr:Hsp20 family protein [Victivallales bacterium]
GLSSGGSGFGGDAADSIRSNTMSETKDGYTLRMKIPGLDKSSLDVRLRNNTLIVSGSRNQQVEQSAGGSRFLSSSFSSFSYSFHVPGQVGSDKLEVSYDDDILDVLIRK